MNLLNSKNLPSYKIKKLFKISNDFLLNLISVLIPIGLLQLLVYPMLARFLDMQTYGYFLSVIGISNIISVTCGTSLNNLRLLVNKDYNDRKLSGDFNVILLAGIVISNLVFFFILLCGYKCDFLESFLYISLTITTSVRAYANVEYRLNLDYKKILKNNLIAAVGIITGIVLFYFFKRRELSVIPFLFGEVFGILHILFSTKILSEALKITELFRIMLLKEMILILATFISNLTVYLDRIILTPLLGAETVSIYSVASFFGKGIGTLISPLSGVLLSYYVSGSITLDRKKFRISNLIIIFMGIITYGICLLFSDPITGLFYPTIIESADQYIGIANLTMVINFVCGMVQPAVLKYTPLVWQIFIQLAYLFIYIGGGYVAIVKFGMHGFVYAALAAIIVRLLILLIVGDLTIGKQKSI